MQIATIYAQAETHQQAASEQQADEPTHAEGMQETEQRVSERQAAMESRPREQSGKQSWPEGEPGHVSTNRQKRAQAKDAARRGATGTPRNPKDPRGPSTQKSARRIIVTARGVMAEPEDGRILLRVRGRPYILDAGPYGATWRAPNGAVVLHSDAVPDTPEQAAAELEAALEEAAAGGR